MEDEQPDSLEGWVPVRDDLFAEPERHQLRFLVAWNDAEGKFAVTCHDRTAQRRRREGSQPEPEPERAASPPSWAGLLSAAGLRGAHRQLAALWPPLERCFPPLPPELDARAGGAWGLGLGLWALVWPARAGPGDAAVQELCGRLERYLGEAASGCGGAAVRDALFPADGGAPDCESLRDFRERALRARWAAAGARLRQVLQGHDQAHTMVALMKVYREEDEAYQELVTGATTFFQYLLQPFRDMREVATLCKLDILKSLNEDDLGPKRIVALQKEAKEWTRQAEEAVVSIQDITVNYFKETVKALAEMQKQMEQDKKRFGQAAWATATPRLEELKLMLARETLQLMRAKELCLNHKRAEIQRKMEDLPEQEKNVDVVDELEIQYYEVQLELYEVKFEILKYEEILLITQLDSIKRLIKDKEDEVVYYDPCESPEELGALDCVTGLPNDKSVEVRELSRQRQRLETQRGTICARRACLRNRKDQCKENHRLRLQLAEERMKHFHQHHSIQVKRDKMKEEEKKKKEWINQERKKTLQRLRAFKERCPGGSVLKTSCSEPAAPHLPGGLSLQTSPAAAASHLSSGETRRAPPSEVNNAKTSEDLHDPGNTAQSSVLVGDQTHCRSSEELSPPPPPLPPPLPPPPPPPPPPFPARPFSYSQSTNRQNSHLRTPVAEDQPLPLMCEPSAGRPHYSSAALGGPGSMDEVLASLRSSSTPLRRVEAPTLSPPRASFNEQLLAAIRQGVKLKKVHSGPGLSPSNKPASDLERSIKAALQRIKRVSADSEEEEGEGEGEDGDEQSPGGCGGGGEWDR
ncbi:WASP homolog-associated protein with actin, membranes and microtubules isoform X1 [Canis lupus familiaris]|nr:WASP homolog-associated protein with actin, membranes and microtubules isoform X1 [Canis lupus dingo]XP_038332072.1 WASP homolog-associated protein with actin, membranes and microtubules isoform X1 [Canis lupus familiaris]XP_038388869.1 WASP homolog-associated protein with actin, membranes and microtubules isoform X1 [Canis lupus familiaris]XP_038517372.1 WASP homolog-associated protein with actin, membranes and microtubules isoform X1 [Canis lupus familiaris]